MELRDFERNPERVIAALVEVGDKLVTKKDLKILIPARFEEHGLAELGIETKILGMFMLIVENKYYGTMNFNNYCSIDPTSTTKVMFGEDEYIEFYFEPGSTVITNLNLVKNDAVVYKIFNEMIGGGRIPQYVDYITAGGIFDTARDYAGANIGQQREVTELIISMNARDVQNRHLNYRNVIEKKSDVFTRPPAWVGLRSVTWSATNTTAKLLGNHFDEGVTSALVTPSERTESIERLLRL